MRKRPNLAPRLESCAGFLVGDAQQYRGRWLEAYPGHGELWLELGCGKGRFTADMAAAEPSVLLLALERVADAMVIAAERVRNRSLENVRFINDDASKLALMFAPGEVGRIFINFCDPWPKSRDAKFRLTAPAFLRAYAGVLPVGGQIHFKTDNTPLFMWSMEQLQSEGWELSEVTGDLHGEGAEGILTDYEAKFLAEGLKINRLVATRAAGTLGAAAGPVPRLRNAALADARGCGQPPVEDKK